MKTLLKIAIFIILAGCHSPQLISQLEQNQTSIHNCDWISVYSLQKPFPETDICAKQQEFLWSYRDDADMSGLARKFSRKNWEHTFTISATALVEEAKLKELNYESLGHCLDLVRVHSKEEVAYIPISAVQTTCKGELIWIIEVLWEDIDAPWEGIGHIRHFAYDQDSLDLISFVTCM